ncbi:MAG: hypothetical protein LUE93_16990 [Bacteroides sp.]|nr:hypothetical protein [Bacteroides sp.]
MAINYYVVERKVPGGPNKGKTLQYGQVVCGNLMDFDSICHEISLLTTATSGDAKVVLNSLLTIIGRYIKAGHIVQVGKLGNLRPTAGSRPAETPQEVTAHLMKRPKIVFTPGKTLKNMLTNISYRRIEPQVVRVEEECDDDHDI